MTAFLPEERQLLHDSIGEYLSDNYPTEHAVRLAREEPDGFGRKHWEDYARLGWLGLTLPEGAGGGLTEAGILFAAAGRHLVQEPLLATLILGAGALARLGSPAQQGILTEVAEGRRLLCLAHYEADSGFDRARVTATAARSGAGFSLTADKAFTLGAHAADTIIVSARIGEGGPVGLFLAPGDAPGVERVAAPALDGRRGAAIRMTGVELGPEALLGEAEDDRLAEIDRLIDRAALMICAEAVGAMTAVAEATTAYLKSREQFSRPLSDFQVLQHRVVDMHLMGEKCRAMVHAALDAADHDDPDAARRIWRTKLEVAEASRFVGAQGVQLHGGMGMTDELAIGHYYKRLAMCEAMFGDADWHLDRLADAEGESRNAA